MTNGTSDRSMPRPGTKCMHRDDGPDLGRRNALAWGAGFAVAACALPRGGEPDRITGSNGGQAWTMSMLLERAQEADVVLLGELHDNPRHHAGRAALVAALPATVVVVEYLQQGRRPELPVQAEGDTLRAILEGDGFDAKGWQWPLHEPLFKAMASARHELQGGNLAVDVVRTVAKEGAAALPAEIRSVVDAAPMSAGARDALERDLLSGHCGHLSAARLPAMVWAQRARDAAMARTLADQWRRRRAGAEHGPVILLAGNGHVRRDYGVPQLLSAMLPQARLLAVCLLEPGHDAPPCDVIWTTAAASRDDPCRGFSGRPRATT